MLKIDKARMAMMLLTGGLLGYACGPATAAVGIEGRVDAGGGPLAKSTVTLWAASAGEPKQLAQTKSASDGRFRLQAARPVARMSSSIWSPKAAKPRSRKASGNNPAIALLAVLGSKPPAKVVINEMTTVASVWTMRQFLDGAAINGRALGLGIAAGNVPNFVDLQTGGWGAAIQDPLNSGQTPTMANFATLADVLAGLRHARDKRCVR